jgi:methionyl-tRNA synthetase
MMPWYLGSNRVNFVHWWGGVGFGLLALWSLIWTGLALWHAARRQEKGWFIFFLLVHTAGIVEFIYLLFIAKIFTTSVARRSKRKK